MLWKFVSNLKDDGKEFDYCGCDDDDDSHNDQIPRHAMF